MMLDFINRGNCKGNTLNLPCEMQVWLLSVLSDVSFEKMKIRVKCGKFLHVFTFSFSFIKSPFHLHAGLGLCCFLFLLQESWP